jgi:hypothetical protein
MGTVVEFSAQSRRYHEIAGKYASYVSNDGPMVGQLYLGSVLEEMGAPRLPDTLRKLIERELSRYGLCLQTYGG